MPDYSKQMVKYTKLFSLAFAVIYIIKGVLNEYLYSVYVSLTLSAGIKTAAGVLLAIALWAEFHACFGKPDKATVYKLLPFAFSPLFFLSLSDSVVSRFIGLFLPEASWKAYAVIYAASAVSALLVGVFLLPQLAKWYAGILQEKGALAFPLQYGLRRKWWFDLAASLTEGLLLGTLTVIIPLFTNAAASSWFPSLTFILGTVLAFGLRVLFFRIAFANIDRETRKLFYAHLSGIAGYMALTDGFISFARTGITSLGTRLSDVSGGTLQMLAHSYLLLLVSAVVSLLLLIIGYQYLIRTLKVYEYQIQ